MIKSVYSMDNNVYHGDSIQTDEDIMFSQIGNQGLNLTDVNVNKYNPESVVILDLGNLVTKITIPSKIIISILIPKIKKTSQKKSILIL